MPRRNIYLILSIALFSILCYQRVGHNRYSRYLGEVFQVIDKQALDPVSQEDLFDGAMSGIVERLKERGDIHSGFISESEREEFEVPLKQQFGGVGVMIRMEDMEDNEQEKRLVVINPPHPGTPAFKAEIRMGDEITEIDGKSTRTMTMDDVVEAMRGEIGTPVSLTFLHADSQEPITKEVIRDEIIIPSVIGDYPREDGSWEYRLQEDPRIGYLRITTFGDKTASELTEVLENLKQQRIQALLIDLRDNPGGYLTAGVETCDMFLRGGKEIVSIRGRDPQLNESYVSSGDGQYTQMPIAILVNKFSASASEIVSACLQDHDRAVIVGERTWGKGTVQHVIRIQAQRSILKLTAAKYIRPNGKNIDRRPGMKEEDQWGVSPNPGFEVKLTEKQRIRLAKERSRRDIVGQHNKPPEPEEPATDKTDEPASEKPAPKQKSPEQEKPAEDLPEEETPDPTASQSEAVDPQLERALEYLRQKIEQREGKPAST